jgi:hypothetical protein
MISGPLNTSGEAIAEQNVVLYPATNLIDPPLTPRNLHLSLIRVGTGNKKYGPGELNECGTTRFIVSCKSGHTPTRLLNLCGRYACSCPACYEAACTAGARDIAEHIDNAPAALLNYDGRVAGEKKHIVLSTPLLNPDDPTGGSLYTEADFLKDGGKKVRVKANRILRRFARNGFYGGTLIFHPWRKKHVDDGSECDDPNCKDREHYWHWGPHYHYVGYGFFAPGNEVYEKTGWILKRIEEADGAVRDAYATARYQLTHAGIFIDLDGHVVDHDDGHESVSGKDAQYGHAYSYVGFVHDLGSEITRHEQVACHCEECQQEVYEYHETAADSGLPDLTDTAPPLHMTWEIEKRWFMRDRRTYKQTTVELKPENIRWDPDRKRLVRT